MLDSLGSTLSHTTVDSFFIRHNKKPREDTLMFAEVIQCLETELGRPDSEKKIVDADGETAHIICTPNVMGESESAFMKLSMGDLDFTGPDLRFDDGDISPAPPKPPAYSTEPSVLPLAEVTSHGMGGESGAAATALGVGLALTASPGHISREVSFSSSDADVEGEESSGSGSGSPSDSFERVINVKNCPLCHRPRLNSKAEVDIVTHLAICASKDWAKVDRIVVGNFVTASQAQRKWYTKVITKVSSGNYKLGAVSVSPTSLDPRISEAMAFGKNSANIIVQNRITGQLEEEKMQVYVRLGIRLLYKVSACSLPSVCDS
jgi:phosphatidylserine decarboxylase